MADTLESTVSILGGARILGTRKIRSDRDLHELIREGLPVAALEHAVVVLGVTQQAIVDGMGLARKILPLRNRRYGELLGCIESERTVRLARVAAIGTEALGSTTAAGRWLQHPNRALGGLAPVSLLQTDFGTREVEAILVRALYGGYS